MRDSLSNPYAPTRYRDWETAPRIEAIVYAITGLTAKAGASYVIAYALTYLAVTAATSWAINALTPRPDFSGSQGLLTNTRNPTAPQNLVYGEVRKGGVITFLESNGTGNKYLHEIICLAGHEVNSIGDIYINDKVVTLDTSGNVTDADWKDSDGNSKILIKKFTGSATQNVYTILNALSDGPTWQNKQTGDDTNFRGQGIACIYVRMEFDADVFSQGVPLFTAKVQGKKVFDPRNSSTAYSSNPALCIRDYIVSKYGLNNSGTTNDTTFAAAANACDENVTLSAGGTENRYEMHGVVSLDQKPSEILADMMTSCAGTLFWGTGKWQLKVGEYSSPVFNFNLDHFRGPIVLDTKHSRSENFNIVRGTFADASEDYIRADYPQVRSATFVSNDNGIESALDLGLPFTTSSTMAQRLAKMTLFRLREQMTLVADFSMDAFTVQVGDFVTITNARYGWSNKEFECVGWRFSNNGEGGSAVINMTLRETSAAAFSWSAEEAAINANDSTLNKPPSSTATNGLDAGVLVIYATDASGTGKTTTYSNQEYVKYHSYVGTAPSVSSVTGTWVKFIGDDGDDGSSTTIIYRKSNSQMSAPTASSTTPLGWYTYTNITGPSAASPLWASMGTMATGATVFTWSYPYKIEGVDGADGTDGTTPANGTNGDTVATGRVYYQTLQASPTPTISNAGVGFNFASGVLSSLPTGWAQTQPSVAITNTTLQEWSAPFTATLSGGSTTIAFGTVTGAIQVTTNIQSDNYVADSAGWSIQRDTGNAEFQNATIRGTLDATDITAGTLNIARIPTLSTARFDAFTVSSFGSNQDAGGNGYVSTITYTPTNTSNVLLQAIFNTILTTAGQDDSYTVGFNLELNGSTVGFGRSFIAFDTYNNYNVILGHAFQATANTQYTIKIKWTQGADNDNKNGHSATGFLSATFTQI